MSSRLAFALILSGVASPLAADDLYPATWRYGPDTSFHTWSFDSEPTGDTAADAGEFGGPAVFIQPYFEDTYDAEFMGRDGVLSTHYGLFNLPGSAPAVTYAEIIVQLATYDARPAFEENPEFYLGLYTDGFFPSGPPWILEHTHWQPLPEAGWRYDRYRFYPINPHATDGEQWFVLLDADHVDQVVIDARIPEPATLTTLALAAVAVIGRRRQ
ncbi:MAG: hypothetical protein KDA33_00335 [Phycisphaerales bacterium]|nr:hypothetical protein [Phycisphaerales bacterium]